MKSILMALAGVVAPGFAHGLMGQRRAMWIAMAAVWAAGLMLVFTIWAIWLMVAVAVGILVDAGLRHRRLTKGGVPLRFEWMHPLIAFAASIVLALGFRVFVAEAFKIPSSSMYPTLQIGDHLFIEKVWRSYDRGDLIVFRQPCEPDRDYVSRVIAVGGDTIEIRCSVVFINGKAVPRELVDANASYEDYDEGWGQPGQWHARDCSRYRETIDGRSFEIFHDADLPKRDRERDTEPLGDQKDFPQDPQVRSCGNQDNGDRPRPAANQAAGRIVIGETPPNHCMPRMHYVVPAEHVFVMGDNRANSNDSRYWGSVPRENIKGHLQGIWKPLARFGAVR